MGQLPHFAQKLFSSEGGAVLDDKLFGAKSEMTLRTDVQAVLDLHGKSLVQSRRLADQDISSAKYRQ